MAEVTKTPKSKATTEAAAPVPTAAKKAASAVKEVKTETPVAPMDKFTKSVFDLTGKEVGTVQLPKEIFGGKVNEPLLLQALRVYQNNQHQGTSSTKTRSEVRGGGAKPWKQKGTGRARAGSNRSPIWRGGGIIHGPRPHDINLDLPTKMRRAALRSALVTKLEDIIIVNTLKTKESKTKQVAQALKALDLTGKKLLFVLPESDKEVVRASRNISKVNLTKASDLNAWQVIHSAKLVLDKDALTKLPGSKESNDTN